VIAKLIERLPVLKHAVRIFMMEKFNVKSNNTEIESTPDKHME
jgi:hypothetical protein